MSVSRGTSRAHRAFRKDISAQTRREENDGEFSRSVADSSQNESILIIDDLAHKREEISNALAGIGFSIDIAKDCRSGWEKIKSRTYACVISDLKTPGMDGLELIEHVRMSGSNVPIVLLSGFATVAISVAAMKRGAQHVYRYEELDFAEFARHIERLARGFLSE